MSCSPSRSAGFTLLEAALALLVMTLLAAALVLPLAAQIEQRRIEETRRRLDEAREALLGFAVSQGRLPCPAPPAGGGLEAFAPGGDAVNGTCAVAQGGLLPAATLGLAGVDAAGYTRDGWDGERNRIRYAVADATVNGVAHVFTRTQGLQAATLAGLGEAPHFLHVCAAGPLPASGCGAGANHLTRKAVFVLLSPGANAWRDPAPGSDEARNLEAAGAFVSRDASNAPGAEFDDLLQWVSLPVLASRMIAAGRLP